MVLIITLRHTYIYIYIYIYACAVKLLSGPSFGFLNVTNWAKSKGTNRAKVIFGIYLEWFHQ